MPLDELSSRRTDYATGEKLAAVFGRQGKTKKVGNHHALKVREAGPSRLVSSPPSHLLRSLSRLSSVICV